MLKRGPKICKLGSGANCRECIVPKDQYFYEVRPQLESYEIDLLQSIGFDTIVNLPHPLLVSSKEKFVMHYLKVLII